MKNKNLMIIDTTILNDETLSWAAKGVYAYLASHEKDENNINFIIKADKETVDAINELINAEYLVRH